MTPGPAARMRRYWDRRAREDPYFFVDTRLAYGAPDLDRFWMGGEEALDGLLRAVDMRVDPGDVVVEIGCGVGRMTRPLAARAGRVLALDVSPEMLALARAHNEELDNVEWILGDGESLTGVADASVDGCVSLVVFQHVTSEEVVLGYVREIGRALKPGGWAAFQVSTDPSVHRRPGIISRFQAALGSRLSRGPKGQADPAWLGTAVGLDRIRETATDAGLSVESVVGEGTQYCLLGTRRLSA